MYMAAIVEWAWEGHPRRPNRHEERLEWSSDTTRRDGESCKRLCPFAVWKQARRIPIHGHVHSIYRLAFSPRQNNDFDDNWPSPDAHHDRHRDWLPRDSKRAALRRQCPNPSVQTQSEVDVRYLTWFRACFAELLYGETREKPQRGVGVIEGNSFVRSFSSHAERGHFVSGLFVTTTYSLKGKSFSLAPVRRCSGCAPMDDGRQKIAPPLTLRIPLRGALA